MIKSLPFMASISSISSGVISTSISLTLSFWILSICHWSLSLIRDVDWSKYSTKPMAAKNESRFWGQTQRLMHQMDWKLHHRRDIQFDNLRTHLGFFPTLSVKLRILPSESCRWWGWFSKNSLYCEIVYATGWRRKVIYVEGRLRSLWKPNLKWPMMARKFGLKVRYASKLSWSCREFWL